MENSFHMLTDVGTLEQSIVNAYICIQVGAHLMENILLKSI